jgi:hypothetical protein
MVASTVLATVTRLEYVNVVTTMRTLLFNVYVYVYTDLYDIAIILIVPITNSSSYATTPLWDFKCRQNPGKSIIEVNQWGSAQYELVQNRQPHLRTTHGTRKGEDTQSTAR